MDVYGLSTPEFFRIDDLLDFSNDSLFSSSSSSDSINHPLPPPENYLSSSIVNPTFSTDDLCVPSEDVAELEWLSRFVDDSFTDFPSDSLNGTLAVRPESSFSSRVRSKRSRAIPTAWTSSPESNASLTGKVKTNSDGSGTTTAEDGRGRRCTHCASEKTPQWRTGPLGPKTLCNACGVRYKSGRLVPEYRPAASPSFVLTQHSNSHRKVMELRRQKEISRQQEGVVHRHHHHHRHDF